MTSSLIFILVTAAMAWMANRQYGKVIRNIRLGMDEPVEGPKDERWRNMILVAFGQKKMFSQPLPAMLHLFIYVAFLLTQVELIEIFLDGLTGHHRMLSPYLGGFYTALISCIEILSLLALVATLAFLSRRNLLRVPRFWKPEMKGWPFRDANLILLGEILLITGIFCMNGADTVLQGILPDHYPSTGHLAISSWFGPAVFGDLSVSSLQAVERFGWWLHILVVYGFILYLPVSKHLHILFAFPNTWFAPLTPKGRMTNMPEIMQEVRSMMGLPTDTPEGSTGGDIPEFGAGDVTQLSWRNILEAYSCTECGRCTARCPANLTGKQLSPRKVMMAVRDRAEEIGLRIDTGDPSYIREELRSEGARPDKNNYHDGQSLFDRISPEEIHACTTCQACVEACPVMINPMQIILQMRRYEILTQSAGPADWLPLFNSLENSGSAWQIADARDQWVREM